MCGDGIANFYDWTGLVELKELPLLFSQIKEKDPIWYQRIWNDCVL